MSTPIRAIRQKCLECAGGSKRQVRCCDCGPGSRRPCSLHPYRMGKNPSRAGIGRAMSHEDALSARKLTTQVVVSVDKKSSPGVSTPEINLGDPRADPGHVNPGLVVAYSPRPGKWYNATVIEVHSPGEDGSEFIDLEFLGSSGAMHEVKGVSYGNGVRNWKHPEKPHRSRCVERLNCAPKKGSSGGAIEAENPYAVDPGRRRWLSRRLSRPDRRDRVG